MEITHKISMDFGRNCIRPRIAAVQGDSYTRVVELTMYENGAVWLMPEGAKVFVRYRKSDNTGGVYDLLPDGTPAWSAQGNVLRVVLAPQMLTVEGCVDAQVEIVLGTASLGSFTFFIIVEKDPSVGVLNSENYVNLRGWLEEQIQQVVDSGALDGPPGATPELQIGTVTTLSAGEPASATITGTKEKPLLNLGLPGTTAIASESEAYPGCYYRRVGGFVEWLNPPMILDVKYRTSQRYLGQPVYQVCFAVKELAEMQEVSKALPEVIPEGVEVIVESGGQLSDGKMLPYLAPSEAIYLAAKQDEVRIWKTGNAFEDVTATVWLKYVRSCDTIIVGTDGDAVVITTSLAVNTDGDTIMIGGV